MCFLALNQFVQNVVKTVKGNTLLQAAVLIKSKMIKNGCKIIREAGSQSWPTDSNSHHNNIVIDDLKVSCTAKSSDRHYDV